MSLALASCGGVAKLTANSKTVVPKPASTPIVAIVDSSAGLARCQSWQATAPKFQLEAAFDSTAGEIAGWLNNWVGQDQFAVHGSNPAMKATVCYLHGPWDPPQPPGRNLVFDRAIMFVYADGSIVQGPFGNGEDQQPDPLPLTRPTLDCQGRACIGGSSP
jgi:hypothetical protein